MGLYGHHKSLSQTSNAIVPCCDAVGTVESVGSGVTSVKVGDRVTTIFNQSHLTGQILEADMSSGLGFPLPGVLTEYRVFDAVTLVKPPAYLTDEEASCLPIGAPTAWMSLNSFQPIGSPISGSDKYVLLQGTGGVSISGLQIAHALGLKTIVTSSSDEKLVKARKLGADHTINYKTTPKWDDKVLEITGGRGADVIFECGGAQTLAQSFACVAFGGIIAAIGYLSGKNDGAGGMNANTLALKRNVTFKVSRESCAR
jgi:NADPH:quinone reductase-like Zn-dependent oxidoreductase